MRSVVACLLLVLFAVPAHADPCENVSATCALTDLGNDQYEYLFTITNGSPDPNGIFFWVLESGNAPQAWETIGWDVPPGWVPSHPGPSLHFFATNNGSGSPWRLYSPSAALCGTSAIEFRWTFHNNGGPTPDCDFSMIDYTFHMQGVDPSNCWNVGDSFVCPPPVPVESATWGTIKSIYEN